MNSVNFYYHVYIALVLILNLVSGYLVRFYNVFYMANQRPLSYTFGIFPSLLLIFILFFLTYKLNLFKYLGLGSVFIIAGVLSNFLEKAIFGYVADYMKLGYSYINLADICIFAGIVLVLWVLIISNSLKDKVSDYRTLSRIK